MNKRTFKNLYRTYDRAIVAVKQHHYDEAVRLFTMCAQKGFAPAMIPLGNMYYYGRGRTPDTKKAVYWLRIAADKGSHAACRNLGDIFYAMENNAANNASAWHYYNKAAALDVRDLFYLGRMLYEKRMELSTEKQRLEDAEFFFQDSLTMGNAESALYIWKMYRDTDVNFADIYYRDGEKLLKTAKDYNNFAWELFQLGEAEKALPYIVKCMSLMSEQGIEHPAYLDTYAEILYALDRREEAEPVFRKCLQLYRERDERRWIADTLGKIQQKFGYCETTYK